MSTEKKENDIESTKAIESAKVISNRKALLIGILYTGMDGELKGCVNDVINLKEWLMSEHGFKPSEITMMTEASDSQDLIPSYDNILREIGKLVASTDANSVRFFTYSGHGGRTRDFSRDEEDGYDETICALDYSKGSKDIKCITDDVLRERLVNPLPLGAKLTCIFDSCHSGTILDLRYNCTSLIVKPGKKLPAGTAFYLLTSENYKRSDATIVVLSGCRDAETSADAFINGQSQGALVSYILSSWKKIKANGQVPTYKDLLEMVCVRLSADRFTQNPHLSSGNFIDLTSKFTI
jgi:hypothetical protein